jgi:hypothetical protein
LNSNIIVEVLSDSTERVDPVRSSKPIRRCRASRTTLLVASKRVRVEHFARVRHFQPVVLGAGDSVSFAAPRFELPVQALYARVF